MAMSKLLLDEKVGQAEEMEEKEKDLTRCGICLCPIQNPKALPCLHSFCLTCLTEWAKDDTEKIKCPVCKDEFPLPKGGVAGLRSNFYAIKLKKTQALREQVVKKAIKCTFCDKTDANATARCLDCKEYLCESCVANHKTYKALKMHKVQSFDDISSGKVDIQKIAVKEFCLKHEDQVLWFYCETCDLLVCQACTVVDHHASSHTLVNVEDTSGEQRKKLDDLLKSCKEVALEVKKTSQAVEGKEKDLNVAIDDAKKAVEEAMVQAEKHLLTMLKRSKDKALNEIDELGSEHMSVINSQKDSLHTQHLQLDRAFQMTQHIIEKGSPYDMAAMYTTLMSTLQRLSDMKPCDVDGALADIKFEANESVVTMEVPELGVVVGQSKQSRVKHDLSGTWAKDSQICENAGLKSPRQFAFYPSSDMAIACYASAQIQVFDAKGTFKYKIDTKQGSTVSNPCGVVINDAGTAFVTDQSSSVKVFNTSAKLINQFQTYPPGASQTPSSDSTLRGLAMAHNNNLIVGDTKGKYISIHKQSGEHVNSFNVTTEPEYLSAAPSRDIIVTSHCAGHQTQIMTSSGQILHTISSCPIPGMQWYPSGTYFNGDNEFLIANRSSTDPHGAIFHYSTDGTYIGCITKGPDYPMDVAITFEGNIWVLYTSNGVKVFKK